MNINSIARVAARVTVVGATAVALTLGSTSLAGASGSESGSASLSSAPSAARKAPHLTGFAASTAVIGGKGAVTVSVGASGTAPQGTARILALVSKGGQALGDVDITDSRFEYPNAWGRGTRTINTIRFYNAAGAQIGADDSSANFAARSASKGKLKITSTGSRKRAKANVKIYSTSKGKYVTAKRVRLQVLSGGKWRNKKTIKLNRKGTGYYSFRASSKKKYRLVLKTTSTVQGAKTRGIRI